MVLIWWEIISYYRLFLILLLVLSFIYSVSKIWQPYHGKHCTCVPCAGCARAFPCTSYTTCRNHFRCWFRLAFRIKLKLQRTIRLIAVSLGEQISFCGTRSRYCIHACSYSIGWCNSLTEEGYAWYSHVLAVSIDGRLSDGSVIRSWWEFILTVCMSWSNLRHVMYSVRILRRIRIRPTSAGAHAAVKCQPERLHHWVKFACLAWSSETSCSV